MNYQNKKEKRISYVEIDETRCNGCVLCMKACPTKAIRVKENRIARIEGVCIDCGECVRVCPRNAIKAITIRPHELEKSHFEIVSPSPVIYAQFGEDVMPNDILLALRRMGFRYVHDQSYTNEMFNVAMELYIQERRKDTDAPWPLISPICPVVVRLISHRFPSLLQHIPPLVAPREIVAREAKRRLSEKYGCSEDEINVLHITPCPAKMVCIKEPLFQERSYLDAAVGISHVYDRVAENLKGLEEDMVLHHSGGIGLGWGMSGGEIAGLNMNCLAVSGLQETIKYLGKIELGLLNHIDYIEFRLCTEGCLGGPLTVADKYQAKHNLQRLVRMFGVEKRVKYEYVRRLYEKGWFFTDKREFKVQALSKEEISKKLEKQTRVEEILAKLPRKECGVCGSPDCQTFAQDVVEGRATVDQCIFLSREHLSLRSSN